MLLGEHTEFHKLGPKDVGIEPEKKAAMTIDVLRTTNHTGEQIHIQVPVYGTETREEVQKRMGFVFSLIQDRLEEENRAVAWRNARQDTIRRASEASKRNAQRLEIALKNLAKAKRKQNWGDEKFAEERSKLMKEFESVDSVNQARIAHAAEEMDCGKELPYTGPGEDEAFKNMPDVEEDKTPELVPAPQ